MAAFADTTRCALPARFLAACGATLSILLSSCGGGGGDDGGSAVGGAGTPLVLESPASATLIVGQTNGLHVEAVGDGLRFAWEQQRPGGPWEPASGAATADNFFADLRIGPVDIGMDDTRYRGVVSNANGSIATGEAQIDVVWGIVNTLDPNTVFDFGAGGGGFGSADGGTPGGGDGEGAGVGGGLGKTKQVRISVARVADGASLGSALTGANTGLARVKAGPGTAPVIVTLQGTAVGTYYDEGRDAMLPIGADQELHALVGDFDRHLGVTTLTEGAYRYALNNYLQDPAAVRAGTVPLKRTATAEEIARLTPAQIQQANEAVRSEINRVLPARYALDSISTLPTPVENTSPAGSIVDNIYGRMQAVVGGLALAAARFNPSLANPALTMNAQLADDLSDGVIDGRSLDGASVFGPPGAAYDLASLPSFLAAAADAQFARFGSGGGSQPPTAPVVTRQPFSAVITQGNTATLSVVASGSLLSYQWFANGAAVPGGTQPVLTTTTGGQYFVRISNSVGTVDSTTVSVTVTGTPPSAPPVITTQPASASVPSGTTATFTVVATGTNLRYQWSNTGGPLQGQTAASYSTGTAGTYFVVITNEAGSVQSQSATLTVTPRVVAPTITQQPQPVTINAGQSATLSVSASGNPLAFQWFDSDGPIPNATASQHTTGTPDSYYVVVSNSAGSVRSATVAVTVVSAPVITTQPQSVAINPGQSTTLSVVATGLNLTYQWRLNGAPISGATGASYATGTPGTYTVVVTNSAGSVTSSPATVSASAAPTITSQPQSVTINPGQTATLTVVAAGTAPLTYQWRNANGNITGATGATHTTGAAGTYTVVVTNAAGSVTSSAATVTIASVPTITTQPQSVTINPGATATLSVVASGTAPLTYQWRNANGNITGATGATYTTGAAGSYTVVVTNAAGSATSDPATVTVRTAPSITTQPQSVTINPGTTTTLSVVAAGTAPLTYQWRNANGNIANATSSSYTTGVAGTYTVVVTNAAGSVTSSAATVTVRVAPSITAHPQSTTITGGQTATLTVTASGTAPLSYQWRNASGNISGATASSYSTTAAGTYTVVVSNPAGSVTSNPATVTRR